MIVVGWTSQRRENNARKKGYWRKRMSNWHSLLSLDNEFKT